MAGSLNATFTGVAPGDTDWPHPAGVALARLLHDAVKRAGWSVDDLDNWRDVGWHFISIQGTASLEVIVSAEVTGRWILLVAPAAAPGLVGRLFGARPSASIADVLGLASVVHRALIGAGPYEHFRWQWDGLPTEASDPQPMERA